MRELNMAVIGAGRIGKLHAENIATQVRCARLAGVADLNLCLAQEVAARCRISVATDNPRVLLDDPQVDGVAICSATETHAQLIVEAAAAGKHIFCEKPVDFDLARIHQCLEAVGKAGVKLQIGFNRRFDPSFVKVRDLIASGAIGQPQVVRITSRDPAPPPIDYIKSSGGLFLDMTIHDFDMVRFLTGSEAEEIHALGDALVDAEIGRVGDVDTAVVTLRLANGALASIDNSRRAAYGYDQRAEVLGSSGLASASNRPLDCHSLANADGFHSSRWQGFIFDRYRESYIAEIQSFVDCVLQNHEPAVNGHDGRMAVVMALAARQSLQERRAVALNEISRDDATICFSQAIAQG
ncbi:MAG: inositol 2-dehydrogenase [Verrucomicrobiota bacterium]